MSLYHSLMTKIELAGAIPITDEFTVGLADNATIERHWGQVQETMRDAFDGATYFEEGRTVENGIRHIGRALKGELDCEVGHAVALDQRANEVVGGIFCVPTSRPEDRTDADIGWIFVGHDVPIRVRPRVMDGLVACVMTTLVDAGYQRLVTRMGSVQGAKMLSHRYSIAQEPLPGQPNRWVGTATKSNLSK